MSTSKVTDFEGCEIFVNDAGKFFAHTPEGQTIQRASLSALKGALRKQGNPVPLVRVHFGWDNRLVVQPNQQIVSMDVNNHVKDTEGKSIGGYSVDFYYLTDGEIELMQEYARQIDELMSKFERLAGDMRQVRDNADFQRIKAERKREGGE